MTNFAPFELLTSQRQVEKFKYFRAELTSDSKYEDEVDDKIAGTGKCNAAVPAFDPQKRDGW